jgi:hypothetical protein
MVSTLSRVPGTIALFYPLFEYRVGLIDTCCVETQLGRPLGNTYAIIHIFICSPSWHRCQFSKLYLWFTPNWLTHRISYSEYQWYNFLYYSTRRSYGVCQFSYFWNFNIFQQHMVHVQLVPVVRKTKSRSISLTLVTCTGTITGPCDYIKTILLWWRKRSNQNCRKYAEKRTKWIVEFYAQVM